MSTFASGDASLYAALVTTLSSLKMPMIKPNTIASVDFSASFECSCSTPEARDFVVCLSNARKNLGMELAVRLCNCHYDASPLITYSNFLMQSKGPISAKLAQVDQYLPIIYRLFGILNHCMDFFCFGFDSYILRE